MRLYKHDCLEGGALQVKGTHSSPLMVRWSLHKCVLWRRHILMRARRKSKPVYPAVLWLRCRCMDEQHLALKPESIRAVEIGWS